MERITILSPHCYDSSFSLGLTLSRWGSASIRLQVLNFFTRSAYAPHSSAKTVEEISAVRKEEDAKALAFTHSSIEVTSLDLLDAPLRLDIPFGQITQAESAKKISPEELHQLSQHIQHHCITSLAVAPLGLGNHVDHMAVHRASIDSLPPQRLAFYEDLPYATWTSSADLQARIESIQHKTGVQLNPLIWHMHSAVVRKRQIASFYQSQITNEEADAIAQYAETCGDGERLWLPVDSQSWNTIRLLATEPLQRAIPRPPK